MRLLVFTDIMRRAETFSAEGYILVVLVCMVIGALVTWIVRLDNRIKSMSEYQQERDLSVLESMNSVTRVIEALQMKVPGISDTITERIKSVQNDVSHAQEVIKGHMTDGIGQIRGTVKDSASEVKEHTSKEVDKAVLQMKSSESELRTEIRAYKK